MGKWVNEGEATKIDKLNAHRRKIASMYKPSLKNLI